jgi:hypothetical protein
LPLDYLRKEKFDQDLSVTGDTQRRVDRILASILTPISKLLIKNNISLQMAVETLKRCLVQTAADSGASTDSLISLKTGVHRKDVKRLRAASMGEGAEKSPIKGLAIVLSVWANDPAFRNAKGQPRILHRTAKNGFDDLIRASKVDLGPATVLHELTEQGLINQHDDGGIELLSPTFIAHSGEATLKAFEATVNDHIRIATDNVLAPPGAPRHFDQVVRYSHLSDASVQALEAEARKRARAYLEHMNAMAHRLQTEDDAAGKSSNGRFVSGVYIAPRRDGKPDHDMAPPKEDKET